MDKAESKKMLEKQLQLLSERSKEKDCTVSDLCELTQAMVSLISVPWPSCE